jgi:hypothetical protein
MTGTDLPFLISHKRGKNVSPVPTYCTPLDVAQLRVGTRPASVYQCGEPASLDQLELVSGHTLLVWNDAGVTCEVSFHGHSQVNVDLDLAEANATVLVSPRRR